MPLYEYKCENCGETFEALQHFSDKALTVHPKCGGGPVARLLSPPALHFKGSGWYVTDYAKSGSSGSTGSSSKNGTSESSTATSTATPAPAPAKSDSTSGSTATKP